VCQSAPGAKILTGRHRQIDRRQKESGLRSRRIAAITPVDVVCHPETWWQTVRCTTFRVPDSDYTASPFRELLPRTGEDGLLRIELDAGDLNNLFTYMIPPEDHHPVTFPGGSGPSR
jgi:hypothetical protein